MLVSSGNAPTVDVYAAHHAADEPAPTAPSTSTTTASMDVATVASAPDAPSAPVDMPPPLPDSAAAPAEPPAEPAAVPAAAADVNGQTVPFPSLDAPISLADMPMPMSMPMSIDHMPLAADYAMADPAMPFNNGYPQATPAEQRLSAFARLRFEDGSYYMHTYQIILGRNVQLAHKDMRRLAKVEQLKAKGEQQRAQALLNGGRKRKRAGARSVISEAGGIVTASIDMMPMEYQQRHQSVASQSLSSGSHAQQADSNHDIDHAPQEMLMQALPEMPYQIDNQVPEDPSECPVVPIHPQHITDRTGLKGPKGISRQHAKIYYDFDSGNFCLAVLGSNGLYHEDEFLAKGAVRELSHGDTIIIGMVEIEFYLPDIAVPDGQRNRDASGSQSRPMSFSFENGRGESEDMDDSGSEDQSVNPRHVYHYPVGSEFESDDDLIGGDDDMDDVDDEEEYNPMPPPKPSLKIKLKKKHRHEKPAKMHKRKAVREPTPEEPPPKKHKIKIKDVHKDPSKEKEREKEKRKAEEKEKEKPKASKAPTKAPTKAPSKAPTKEPAQDVVKEEPKISSPMKESAEPAEKPKSESPVIIRRPQPGVPMEDLDPDGLITPEMCAQYGLPQSLIGTYVGKRKGPGRPPKDGVMSKRQRSQLIKQGKEIEKARAAGIDPADLPQPIVKPKVARRKESNAGEDDDVRETTEKGDGTIILGEKKTAKPAKPARTPSPEMRIEDYTEEQLQRPTSNYVVLIHEAISSAPSGQMNLQQIYNYIEKNYPWYKFKTTTSGWQSSVRHNLGQHDAFVKGDKEGKGYMWKINPNVSIEKERRKRQVSPPQVNHAQRPAYYPPPTGYSPYGQPGYYPGMPPQGMPPNGPPRPPPVEAAQPRLPPSMARNAAAAPPTAPAPSPYASPWAGGATAGSPPAPHPPQPYPPNAHAPPTNQGASSGQYGVLFPTSAPSNSPTPYTSAGTYTSPFAAAGQSPYGMTNGGSPYTPYPPTGNQAPKAPPPASSTITQQMQQTPGSQVQQPTVAHPSGRYPLSTNPDLIRQLEAFRSVYLGNRKQDEDKMDNAIRAFVTPELAVNLTAAETALLRSIYTIPRIEELRGGANAPLKQEEGAQPPSSASQGTVDSKAAPVSTTTAAAIAADAAANTAPSNPPTATSIQPQRSTPNPTAPPHTTPAQALAHSGSSVPAPAPIAAIVGAQAQRPSVEPITPIPGSPAVQNGPSAAQSSTEAAHSTPVPTPTPAPAPTDTASGAEEGAKSTDPSIPTNTSA